MKRKIIPTFPNYLISENGTIYSLCFKRLKKLKAYPNMHGYMTRTLWRNNNVFCCKIHRLVALTFLKKPKNFNWVNHKDCNRRNNHVSNLEWSNRLNNTEHAKKNGRYVRGKNHPNCILTKTEAYYIKFNSSDLSYSKLANKFGVSVSTIYLIKNNLNWKYLKKL